MLVKIKTWEQMEKEDGISIWNHTLFKPLIPFNENMERDIPKNRIITINEENKWEGYTITKEMIEEILTPETHPQYFI